MFTSDQKKMIALSSLGGALEFYDFIVFVFLAKTLSALFFPVREGVLPLIETYGLFAVGYIVRPLGGIFFGHFGDKLGRKKIFIATVLLMALPTFLMGCIPTYQQVGIFAPLLLLFLRILQGLSLGGEIPGAMVFVTESVATERRGFACGIIFFGINLGILLGSFVSTLFIHWLSAQSLLQWGWRIPFLLGGVLGILSFYLRKKMQETPLFVSMQQHCVSKVPIKEVFASFAGKVGQGITMASLGAVLVTLLYLFMPTYLVTFFNFPLDKVLTLNTVVIAVFSFQVILMGYLSDKIGYIKMLRLGMLGLMLFSYPIYKMFGLQNFAIACVAIAILAILNGLITSSFPIILVTLFPTRIRYSGVALVYNVGFAFASGLTPVLVTSLIHWTRNVFLPAYYIMFFVMLAFVVTLVMRESNRTALTNQ